MVTSKQSAANTGSTLFSKIFLIAFAPFIDGGLYTPPINNMYEPENAPVIGHTIQAYYT